MGGEKRKSEKARLRKGINILISTPGRLVDHIKSTKNIHFSRIQWLILDEADRLLDLGFEKDITAILNAVNAEGPERQNVLLSATLTDGVARLADVSLNNPVSISVAEEGPALSNPEGGGALDVSAPQTGDKLDSFAIPEGLDQYVTLVPSKLRLVSLVAFILQKCAVGLGSGPGAVEGAGSCVETHALSSQGVCVSVALTRVSPWSGAVGENQRAVTASVFGLGSALSIFPGTDAGAGRIAGGRHVLDVGQLWGPVLGFWGDS